MSTTRSIVALSILWSACSGSVGSNDHPDQGGGNGGQVESDRTSSNNPQGGQGVLNQASACTKDAPEFVGPAPIARLTSLQYQNTLRSLFPSLALGAATLPKETRRPGGFFNQGDAQNPSPEVVERLHDSAESVAAAVAAKLPSSVGCVAPLDEEACGNGYVKSLIEQAFRRPSSDEELARYRKLFATARTEFGFAEAIALAVQTALESPHFLYRVEKGEKGSGVGGSAPLAAHELATRLSYFFTNNMPDMELKNAATSGALLKGEELAKQAKRLLDTAPARAVVSDFQGQWLKLDSLDTLSKSATLYPEFNDSLQASYKISLRKFLDYQTWERGGSWRGLLTDKTAFVDKTLAKIYDVKSEGTNIQKVTLDNHRAGLLSQAGLLASLAHVDVDSPTKRGVFVLENLLCQHVPEPPPNTNTVLPIPNKPMTMRQRMEDIHAGGGDCKACHKIIDGIGFGFSNFDSLGRYRTEENGIATDDSGHIVADLSIDGDFRGVVELSEKVAASREGALCYASQVLAYGRSLARSDLDECAVERLLQKAGEQNPSMQNLMLAVTTSEGFRSLDTSKL